MDWRYLYNVVFTFHNLLINSEKVAAKHLFSIPSSQNPPLTILTIISLRQVPRLFLLVFTFKIHTRHVCIYKICVLYIIHDYDYISDGQIFQDRTKEMEIAKMKEAWAKENPDSLQRGRELREAFIKKHEIKSKSSIDSPEKKVPSHPEKSLKRDGQRLSIVGTSEISMAHLEERTLKPPASLRKLPPLDLTVYEVREDEEDKPRVKAESDEETLRNIRTMNIVYAQDDYAHFLEELENLYRRQKYQYKTLYGRYFDEFFDRRAILEDVYEARRAYISNTKPVAASSTKSTKKSVKSKKSKKT